MFDLMWLHDNFPFHIIENFISHFLTCNVVVCFYILSAQSNKLVSASWLSLCVYLCNMFISLFDKICDVIGVLTMMQLVHAISQVFWCFADRASQYNPSN